MLLQITMSIIHHNVPNTDFDRRAGTSKPECHETLRGAVKSVFLPQRLWPHVHVQRGKCTCQKMCEILAAVLQPVHKTHLRVLDWKGPVGRSLTPNKIGLQTRPSLTKRAALSSAQTGRQRVTCLDFIIPENRTRNHSKQRGKCS